MQHPSHATITLFKLVISAALIAWLVSRMDLDKTWDIIRNFNIWYLGPMLALSLVGILASVWKWLLLLKKIGLFPNFGRLLRLFWIGIFFNNFMPGRTGGDLVRSYGVARNARNRMGAVLSVGIDRGLNLVTLAVIGLFALWCQPDAIPSLVWEHLSYMGLCAIALLASSAAITSLSIRWSSRLKHQLQDLRTTGTKMLNSPALLMALFFLSAFYQITMILSNLVVARGLGLDVQPERFFYLIPATALITMLPISLNGFGLREGAFALLFAHVGLAAETAVALSITITLCTFGISLIGGFFYTTSPLHVGDTD